MQSLSWKHPSSSRDFATEGMCHGWPTTSTAISPLQWWSHSDMTWHILAIIMQHDNKCKSKVYKNGYRRRSCTYKTAKIYGFVRFVMYCFITTVPVAFYWEPGCQFRTEPQFLPIWLHFETFWPLLACMCRNGHMTTSGVKFNPKIWVLHAQFAT